MKHILLILAFIIPSFSYAQSKTCQDFKNGKFYMNNDYAGKIMIIRDGETQIEYDISTGVKIKLRVKWLDECSYTLTPIEILENPNNIPVDKTIVLHVEIIRTTDNSYIQRSSSQKYNIDLVSELFVIEETMP